MPIANGVFKQVRYRRQTTYGVVAPQAGAGALAQSLPRVTSDLDLNKETYKSNALRTDMQRADFRHGTRSVKGKISDELKVAVHEDFFETFCRQTWQAAPTTGALLTVAAASTTGNIGTFTRGAGSYITDGFKVGDVGRWTGWAAPAAANVGKNMMIVGLTPLVMTAITLDGSPIVAKAAGDSVTFTLKGKKTWIPLTGHTNDLYTIEHFYSDINESEIFDSCRLASMNLNLPSTGMATIDLEFLGRDMTTQSQLGAWFTAPAAPVNGTALSAVNGVVVVGGVAVGILTGLTIAGTANASVGQVVGSNVSPDIFMGAIEITGNLTAYFSDVTLRDMFNKETEAQIICAFTTDNTPGADFLAFTMPRVKAGGATKDDGEKGLVITMPYTALLNVNGGAAVNSLATTLSIQDSSIP
jgi:hypothetical protein